MKTLILILIALALGYALGMHEQAQHSTDALPTLPAPYSAPREPYVNPLNKPAEPVGKNRYAKP